MTFLGQLQFGFGRNIYFVLGMGFLEAAQSHLPFLQPRPALLATVPRNEPGTASVTVTKRGSPWGVLEYTQLPLEQPRDFLPDTAQPLGAPRWFFGDCSRARVESVFGLCGFTPAQQADLLQPARWQTVSNGLWVAPPVELVLDLSGPVRQRIYAILANYPENSAQGRPFRFQTDSFETWLGGTGLNAEEQTIFRQLTYRQGSALCFCDGAIMQGILAPARFRHLVKALYGENTLLMQLRLMPGTDFDALMRYWQKGGRAETLRPLLESLARLPGGGTVNISCLLPEFAQHRLYTYADAVADPAAASQNCFWSAMNFFRAKPDDRFLDTRQVLETLATDYEQTAEPMVFGDLVTLLDDANRPIHMCVYLADNVVFTKNGRSQSQPWVLMKMPEVLSTYAAKKESVQTVVFRAKKG